jgi:hypothetical protein
MTARLLSFMRTLQTAWATPRIGRAPAHADQHHLQRVMHPRDHLAVPRSPHHPVFSNCLSYQHRPIAIEPGKTTPLPSDGLAIGARQGLPPCPGINFSRSDTSGTKVGVNRRSDRQTIRSCAICGDGVRWVPLSRGSDRYPLPYGRSYWVRTAPAAQQPGSPPRTTQRSTATVRACCALGWP